MSRHSLSPVNAYSRYPQPSVLSPTRATHASHTQHPYDETTTGGVDVAPPHSARSARSQARERERGRDVEADYARRPAGADTDHGGREYGHARYGEHDSGGAQYQREERERADRRKDREYDSSYVDRYEAYRPYSDRHDRTRAPHDELARARYADDPIADRSEGARSYPRHSYADRDARAMEVRARRREEYGEYDRYGRREPDQHEVDREREVERERERVVGTYRRSEEVDWRNEPASPQRLPPLSSIAPVAGSSGGRMALSSLLDSAPGPAPSAHSSVITGGVPHGTTSPPPLPPSAAALSRTLDPLDAQAAASGLTSALPLASTARQSARTVQSLDYEPVQSSQVFYGAPPGYTGTGGSSRNGHDLRTRGGLTPSYASGMYDHAPYDHRDRERETEADRDARHRSTNGAGHSAHHYADGNSSRQRSSIGGAADAPISAAGSAYRRPNRDFEGSRSPPIMANRTYAPDDPRSPPAMSSASHAYAPGDPRLPPLHANSAYDPAAMAPREYDPRMPTSPPLPLASAPTARERERERGHAGYSSSRPRRETRQSTSASLSVSPVRPTASTIPADLVHAYGADERRGSEYDQYPAHASASGSTRGYPQHSLDGGLTVAAPASARERAYDVDRYADRRPLSTAERRSEDEYDRARYEHDEAAYASQTASARSSRRHSRTDEYGDGNGHSNGYAHAEREAAANDDAAAPANGHVSPAKVAAYKLSDLLTESKEVWEEELKTYQSYREREVIDVGELDLDLNIQTIHAKMLKEKPKDRRTKAARAAKAAALANVASGDLTPADESSDPFDVKPAAPAKGRKGAARPSTGGRGKGSKGKGRKSAANVEVDDELLGLVEGEEAAGTSIAAPSSPRMGGDDEEDELDEQDHQIPEPPDPETIVLPSGLTRREIIKRMDEGRHSELTTEDVKAVQDELWHRNAAAKGAELARRRDGRIKKKPGPAKGWKKLKGEDGLPGTGTKRKNGGKDAPSSMMGTDDEGTERADPASEIGLEEADKTRGDEDIEGPDAAIGALLDEPEPAKPAKSASSRKKRRVEPPVVKQELVPDEDDIVDGAFGPMGAGAGPRAAHLREDDAASERRSSFGGMDDDPSILLPSKRKAGKGKSGGGGKKGKKGGNNDIGPALAGGPLALPTAFGRDPEGSFADDFSVGTRDEDAYYAGFNIDHRGSTDIPPPHAPLHFDVTPKAADLALPPDGGFEEYPAPQPEVKVTEGTGKAAGKGEKSATAVKATNVEDPRGVSVDEAHARLAIVEELQKNIWSAIVKDVPRVYRVMQGFDTVNRTTKNRTALACIRNVYPPKAQKVTGRAAHVAKTKKEAISKAKRAVREMLVYWRKNEKDELLAKKKSEKEALERAKQEEERREAKRQERKLHFLLTQTELYSHFIGKKIKTADAERPDGETGDGDAAGPAGEDDKHADVEGLDGEHADVLPDLDYDEDDEENLRKHAARGAAAHARAAKEKAAQFDQQRAQKAANGDVDLKGVDLDGDELNFQEPSLGANSVTITQPKMLMAQLKEYQLKGLTWLGNLYEQGINGILADEMGLGKTIQSISLLAYLAEKHNLWGPFLVITPVSTLHNWIQEINRFVPALNVIPYWGQPKDREVLRSIWCKRHATYDRDSKFHVLVTSYQMDEKYLSSLRWQYMILDEAQAIKSSSSMRWTTLLGLPCRNRLLLTGTPIQNSMQELWALLHFIMPTLFDSHEEFSEWFSKDIEKTAASGNTGNLQPEQLKRLHMILKPFMLRRVKKHVQKELGEKIEIDVMVDMSQRQKTLYRALRQRVSISELLAQASNLNDSAGTKHLMNLVMQFRKVCSHPDLFERADVVSPFFFGTFSHSGRTTKEGDNMYCPASGRNAIAPALPRLVWEDKVDRPKEQSNAGDKRWILNNMMSIWNPDWVAKRLKEEEQRDDGFGFLRFTDQSPLNIVKAAKGHPLVQLVTDAESAGNFQQKGAYEGDSAFAAAKPTKSFVIPPRLPLAELEHDTPLKEISNIAWNRSVLSRSSSRFAIDAAAAVPIKPVISSRSYISESTASQSDPLITRALYGVAPSERNDPYAVRELHNLVPGISPNGLLAAAPQDQVPRASLNVPPIKRLIVDSAKLARLDELLRELKDGGHRVLLYFQMTKMMDLVEEYLIFRQHKYLRLDGATVLEERRDMVNSWQTNPEIFVFCLSTRAGGLGINLTAADTVIFYDHDWNPSNDAQAMDRAHRVGQTKQVTVYRLITRNTIEERIVRMARAKKDVQDIVVGTKSLNDVAKPSEIASLFMDDEELAESVAKRKQAEAHGYVAPAPGRQQRKSAFGDGLGGMDDDEDDFFSAGPQKAGNNEDDDFADVEGGQQGANAAGIVGNGPAGAPDGKKKSGGSKKKKPTAAAGSGSGAVTPADGDGDKKKGGTKRKAGEGEGKKSKKVKIAQPDDEAEGATAE